MEDVCSLVTCTYCNHFYLLLSTFIIEVRNSQSSTNIALFLDVNKAYKGYEEVEGLENSRNFKLSLTARKGKCTRLKPVTQFQENEEEVAVEDR